MQAVPDLPALAAIVAVSVLTIALGTYGVRTRSTSDFLVAARTVGPRRNAAAISGEYVSAASFLGVAGLVLKDGVDALWYPVGFTAGYLSLLLFVAAPLRRSGAYTLPDFAEARLGSTLVRGVATALVVVIGWLYLVPQVKGAGLTLHAVSGLPEWIGMAAVALVVTVNLVVGGVRAVTFVQAFQYWLKLCALAVPVFVLLIYQTGEPAALRSSLAADAPPFFSTATTVDVETDVVLRVDRTLQLEATGTVNGAPADGAVAWGPEVPHEVSAGTQLRFPAGSPTPVVEGAPQRNVDWLTPLSSGDHELFRTYSLLLTLLLGTMGLPHVLARFYTNPDGRTARATTLVVLVLLALFYVFPVVSGVLARLYVPQLLVTGGSDAAVLLLPAGALVGWPAHLLGALVAAGAFAAFLSTSSGLVVSIAGVIATGGLRGRLRDLRIAAVTAIAVPLAFALATGSLDLAQSVALAFAVAASTFCPLLVLGIWWRGLTGVGATAGLVVGGSTSLAAVLAVAVGVELPGWPGAVLAFPAAITVPLAFLTMVVGSRLSRDRVPEDVSRILLRLHAPDRLGLTRDRAAVQAGIAAPTLPRLRGSGRHRR